MNQRRFIAIWTRLRPRSWRRMRWFVLGIKIHTAFAAALFPFRDPRFWWFSKRVTLHYRLGLPLPLTDRQRGRFKA